ncbi:C4-dicarboxylate ABC transporter substrate-binding protein [Prosthecomicrobium hirschii]|uniref:C4-dicarboxylate ABC transporter substrate-binding protein n=1 Tax=Prosthecodimorpha hirschii TaxID=665126 RepID=A0A0P6WAS1_9HYPH|nr:TRAP transporter substrate-binding protein [Prosthecomicrobium hirschii]KPL55666.1 C4-dicarboxylate ABC transporter substrate-binding protein [Prosthecomicrobium hirschii]
MKSVFASLFAGLVAVSLSGAASAQTVKWDMPTPYPDGNFHTANNRQFVDEVGKATGGRLAITVHSNASLLKLPEIKRGVQTGTVQIGELLVSTLGNEDAIFAFDSIPGLATSYAQAKKLYAIAKPALSARLEKQGMILLYSVAWPPQGVYAKKDMAALADLKGLKFRSYNPATARFAQLLGASPVTVQQAELPQAFRAGLAEAMISSGATGVDTQAWDYLSSYYDTQAFLPQNIVFANKAAFDALSEADRKAVLAAAAAAEARGWAESEKLNEGFKKTMAEKGMKVGAPTATMAAELTKIGETMAAEWADKAGPDGKAIIEAFKK